MKNQLLPKKDRAQAHKNLIDAKIAAELPSPVQGVPALQIVPQCAQSPDTNVCDLGFFNSIDSQIPKPCDLDAFYAVVVC